MANFLNAALPGIAYGNGELQGPGNPGQIVKLVGNDLYEVVNNANDEPFGLLGRTNRLKSGPTPTSTDKVLAVVFVGDGIYETDNFSGSITAGNALTFDATLGNLKAAGAGAKIIGRALSVSDGMLKFQWTNHGTSVPSA
ncbi:MAG: hypothetical protein OEM52_07405 [bacterium]|nr:hypothetical protein [bacterium]